MIEASPCAVAEPSLFRLLRKSSVLISIAGSALLLCMGVLDAFPASSPRQRLPNMLFSLTALCLLVCSAAAYRRPATLRLPAVLAGLFALLALAFSDLGRGVAGWTYTTPTSTHHVSGAAPAAAAIVVAVLGVQVAGKLAQRHACSCE